MAFKTIPRKSLRETGLPKKGVKTTKQITNYLRKNLQPGHALFSELQRLVGREKALSKEKVKTRAKATRADRREARDRIRVVLSAMLDLGLGGLNEVIVHCRAYHVAA